MRNHCNGGGVRGDKAFVRWGAEATLIPITAHLALTTRFPPGMKVIPCFVKESVSFFYALHLPLSPLLL